MDINVKVTLTHEVGESMKGFMRTILEFLQGPTKVEEPKTVGEAAAKATRKRKTKEEPEKVEEPEKAEESAKAEEPEKVEEPTKVEEPAKAEESANDGVTFGMARDLTMEVLQADKSLTGTLKTYVKFFGGEALSDLKGEALEKYYKKVMNLKESL